jgi:hypothetical protein
MRQTHFEGIHIPCGDFHNWLLLSSVIPAKAGIQLIQKTPRSGTSICFVGCAEAFMFSWIPAFAGMTRFMFNELLWLMLRFGSIHYAATAHQC